MLVLLFCPCVLNLLTPRPFQAEQSNVAAGSEQEQVYTVYSYACSRHWYTVVSAPQPCSFVAVMTSCHVPLALLGCTASRHWSLCRYHSFTVPCRWCLKAVLAPELSVSCQRVAGSPTIPACLVCLSVRLVSFSLLWFTFVAQNVKQVFTVYERRFTFYEAVHMLLSSLSLV